MRIGLFTDTYYPEINGVATSTKQLKSGLERLGHEVFVFAPDSGEDIIDTEENVIRKYSIPFVLLKDRRVSVFRFNKAVKQIKKLNLDIVHSQTEFVMGHLAKLTAKHCNIPHIHTYHTVYEDYTHYLKIPGKNSEFIKNLVRKLSRVMCDKADTIVVPTDKVKQLLESYKVKKKIYVQPTGIDCDKFHNTDTTHINLLKKKYNINYNYKVLVTAGRMSKEKNMIELVKYFPYILEKQPDTYFVIIGDGPEANNIKHYVKKLNLQNNVILTGSVSWDVVQDYYALGDIFVCASTSETQGLTYIEALTCGKPLLVRWDDCLEGVLDSGINGIGYNNVDEFVDGYFKISQDYDLYHKNSLVYADKFSNMTFAKNISKIYKSNLNNVK